MGLLATVGKAIASSFGFDAPKQPNTKPTGGDGVQAYGGFLQSPESNPALIGSSKWVTYGNATNTAVVATGLRRALDLLASTEWHAEPNEAGGPDAERGVEIVTKGLIKAQMPKPWNAIVRKTALYRYYGFALHAWTVKRSSDGMMVFSDIAHRPQHTIDGWDKPSEQEPWRAVRQLTRNGNRYVIERGRLFHAVDDSFTDSPEGVGLLRHVVELVRRLDVLEGLEGLAYQTDLRGMPIGRAPLGALRAAATADGMQTTAQIEQFIAERTQTIRNQLANYAKDPSKLQYLLLDSGVFQGNDGNTFAAAQKWAFDLLQGGASGVAEVASAIGRIQLEIARVLGIEFAMVGGGGTAGSYGMHEDKTTFFATNLQTMLTEIANFATNDLARVLVGLNGLDPETATPTLVAQPISTAAVLDTCLALAQIAQSGLQPDDEALPILRKRLRLPPPPAPNPMQLGMLGLGRQPPIPGAPFRAGPGDPAPDLGDAGNAAPNDQGDAVKPDDLGARTPRGKLPGVRIQ